MVGITPEPWKEKERQRRKNQGNRVVSLKEHPDVFDRIEVGRVGSRSREGTVAESMARVLFFFLSF